MNISIDKMSVDSNRLFLTNWLLRFTHGVPFITSPRISKPNATDNAVHQIFK